MHAAHGARRAGLNLVALVSLLALPIRPAGATPPPECASEDFVAEIGQALDAEREVRRLRSGGPEIEATPRFLVVYDQELRLFAPPWTTSRAYGRAFELAEEAWNRSQGARIRALLVFTGFDPGRGDLFYLPLANDVRGLGVGAASDLFDERPDAPLDGLIFLGEPRQLIAAGEFYFREAFLHEISHRWLAYPEVEHPRLAPDALRGRQSAHWSYFVDSGSSPMEGNDWQEIEPMVFRTQLERPPVLRFSPLDLYMMGLMPAHEVPSFRVLLPIETLSPSNLNLAPSSPPAHRSGVEVTVRAEPVEVHIEHVIAASGPRYPEPTATPSAWPIGIVVLSRGRTLSPVHRATLADLEHRLEALLHDFEEATGGRLRLELRVEGAATTPLYGACETPDGCNLAQADRCESFFDERGFCTRACSVDTECGAGVCCPGLGFCAPIGTCSELPALPVDGSEGPVDTDADAADGDPEGASSCGAVGGDAGFRWGLALLLFRLAARRPRWRGSPGAGQKPRLPSRGSLEAR